MKRIAGTLFGLVLLLGLDCQCLTASATATVDAQADPLDRGAALTWKLLKKLHTRASVLMIGLRRIKAF